MKKLYYITIQGSDSSCKLELAYTNHKEAVKVFHIIQAIANTIAFNDIESFWLSESEVVNI